MTKKKLLQTFLLLMYMFFSKIKIVFKIMTIILSINYYKKYEKQTNMQILMYSLTMIISSKENISLK